MQTQSLPNAMQHACQQLTTSSISEPQAVKDLADQLLNALLGIVDPLEHSHAGLACSRKPWRSDARLPQDLDGRLAHAGEAVVRGEAYDVEVDGGKLGIVTDVGAEQIDRCLPHRGCLILR